MRADQGLTLIELLIVIVILGILSAIIVFSVEGITDRGEAASCEASAQTIRVAVEAYYAQNGEYPTDLGQLQGDESFVSDEPVLSGTSYTTASGNTISLGANGAVTDDCAQVGGVGGTPTAPAGSVVASAVGGGSLSVTGGTPGSLNPTSQSFTVVFTMTSGSCNDITGVTVNFTGVTGENVSGSRTGCTFNGTVSGATNQWNNGTPEPISIALTGVTPTSFNSTVNTN